MGQPEDRASDLYECHSRAVLAYCVRRLGETDGADATAAVFAVVVRRLGDVPNGEAELPWLYGVARRVVADRIRSSGRGRRLRRRMAGVRPIAPMQPDHELVRRAEYELAHRALRSLSDSDREVLLLRAWEELTYDEIATVIGTSRDAAAQRGHRAIQRLGKAYRRFEGQQGTKGDTEEVAS